MNIRKIVGLITLVSVAILLAMAGILAVEGRLGEALESLFGKTNEQVARFDEGLPETNRSVMRARGLAAFQLPAPLRADELTALQDELDTARRTYRELTRTLEEEREELAHRTATLESRWAELERMQKTITDRARDLEVKDRELERDLDAYDVAQEKSFKAQAKALSEMNSLQAGEVLMAYDDLEKAASILVHLPSDVQGNILQSLSAENRKRLLPVWDRIETSRQAQSETTRRG
ncbi:MAG: hypothetical protein H6834_05025 [Planctomycetes bacterium]|nr:hypothetical protein [Planctomycetota bacterium]